MGRDERRNRARLAAVSDEILRQQIEAFRSKFGREPTSDDPVFFDPRTDTPQFMDPAEYRLLMIAALKAAGTRPELVFAYEMTGMMLAQSRRGTYPPEVEEMFDAAIKDYFTQNGRST